MKLTKRLLSVLLVVCMVLTMFNGLALTASAAGNTKASGDLCDPFKDVVQTKWYHKAVHYTVENEWMYGRSNTVFGIGSNMKRGELVTMLYRVAGEPDVSAADLPFKDVKSNRFYYNAVVWAYGKNIVAGKTEELFAPEDMVSRQEVVTFFYRFAKGTPVAKDHLSAFKDGKDVQEFAKEAMNWAIDLGIIHGRGGKTLAPLAEVTREEVCQILFKLNGTVLPAQDDITILYTNDVHTYVDKELSYDTITALRDNLKNAGRDVLLVDAGDHIQGTAYGSMDEGKTIIDLMNASRYDLATLGNHEFDYGMERALQVTKDSNFPYVSANFYHEKDGVKGDNVLDPYKVFTFGKVKVAFVGITTPESFTKSTPAYFMDADGKYIYGIAGGEDGKALYDAVQVAVDAASKEADYVIALGHLGDDKASQPWTSEEVIANTTGLDAFIDGHSHSTVEMKTVNDKAGNPVVLTQTGSYFNAIGQMTITADGKISTKLVTNYWGGDRDVRTMIDGWIAEIDRQLGVNVATTDVVFDNYLDDEAHTRLVRKYETNSGDFVADALYYMFDSMNLEDDVDIAIANGGGVRNEKLTGNLTYKDFKNMNPFGNVACLQTVTGQQILDALEWGARGTEAEEIGGFLQVSGLTYEIHTYIDSTVQHDDKDVWQGGPTGEYRVKNVKVWNDEDKVWEPLQLDKNYNLAGYNYCLRDLGDGYAMFNGAVNILDYVSEDYLVLANYAANAFAVDTASGLPKITADNSPYAQYFGGYGEVTSENRIKIVREKPDVPPEGTVEFVFMDTSDVHGQIYATDYTSDQTQSGTYGQGLTRISTYVKEMREKYGDNVFLSDSGDLIQGTPFTYYYAFNKPDEQDPAIKALRTMGYDMWVVGNHEFNYGLEILNRQLDYASSASTQTESQIVPCMANYLDATTNSAGSKDWKTWKGYDPYIIRDFDGVKVAIIGLGNQNIANWDSPDKWDGIYFADVIETYKHYEAEMQEKSDMIVVVSHSGRGELNPTNNSDFMQELVKQTNSISFVFSGHQHLREVFMAKNADGKEIPIVSPSTKAAVIGQVKVTYNKATGEYTLDAQNVDMKNYPLDENLVSILQPYEDATWNDYMKEKIGEASGDFPSANLGTAPSAFVDLINDVQRWGAYDRTGKNTPDDKSDDTIAQLSITAPLTSGNAANLIPKGDITMGDLFRLYRYENWFYQIKMSGKEIKTWLEYSASKINDGANGPTISGGLTYYDIITGPDFSYVIDYSKPVDSRVTSMTYKGAEVKDTDEFTVVINNYRFNGGGDYIAYLNAHGCDFVPNDENRIIYSTQFDMIQGEDLGQARALLADYIREKKVIDPTITSTWKLEKGGEEPSPEETTTFVKVTEDPTDWSGEYLIVAEGVGGKNYAFNGGNADGLDKAGNGVEVAITDNKIEATEANLGMTFTVASYDTGYSLLSKSGTYLGHGDDNKSNFTTTQTAFTFTFENGKVKMAHGDRWIEWAQSIADGTGRFRMYKVADGTADTYNTYYVPALYKLTTEGGGDTPDPGPHVHEYEYKVTTAPTLTDAGVLTGTCKNTDGKCDETTKTVTIPALNTADSYDVALNPWESKTCYTWKDTTYGSLGTYVFKLDATPKTADKGSYEEITTEGELIPDHQYVITAQIGSFEFYMLGEASKDVVPTELEKIDEATKYVLSSGSNGSWTMTPMNLNASSYKLGVNRSHMTSVINKPNSSSCKITFNYVAEKGWTMGIIGDGAAGTWYPNLNWYAPSDAAAKMQWGAVNSVEAEAENAVFYVHIYDVSPTEHVHHYTWKLDPENIPTLQKGGKVIGTCDGKFGVCDAKEIREDIPQLDDAGTNWTRNEDAGAHTYTYTLKGEQYAKYGTIQVTVKQTQTQTNEKETITSEDKLTADKEYIIAVTIDGWEYYLTTETYNETGLNGKDLNDFNEATKWKLEGATNGEYTLSNTESKLANDGGTKLILSAEKTSKITLTYDQQEGHPGWHMKLAEAAATEGQDKYLQGNHSSTDTYFDLTDSNTAYDTSKSAYLTIYDASDAAPPTPAQKKFVEVTTNQDDWTGTYLIAANVNGTIYVFNGSLTSYDAANNQVTATDESGTIAWSDDLNGKTFTFAKKDGSADQYTIKGASGYFINYGSNDNGISQNTNPIFGYTVQWNAEHDVSISNTGGAHLRFNANSGQMRFRFYKSSSYTGQKAITLYKLVEGE